MTFHAIFSSLYIERLLTVVALAAEVAFCDLAHIHLVRSLSHLEYLIMTSGALDPLALDVELMTENDGAGVLRRELDIAASDFLCSSREGNHQAEQNSNYHPSLHHRDAPPS